VEIGVVAGPDASRAIGAAFAAISDVHRLLSFQDPASDLSCLNRAGGRPVRLQRITVSVLRLARAVMRVSGGLFDCTVGGVLERLGALPAPGEIAALERGRADDIVVLDSRHARLRRPVHITLDGIAKGYAVDRAVCALEASGAASGWVNAGGDLRVFGRVSLPLAIRAGGAYRTIGRIANRAVATSAASARPDGSYPGRIVTVRGAPAAAGTWTVASSRAWRADALTKVAALTPPDRRAATVTRLGGTLIRAEAAR
jgi:thiamine biosynthesis lipoprotein